QLQRDGCHGVDPRVARADQSHSTTGPGISHRLLGAYDLVANGAADDLLMWSQQVGALVDVWPVTNHDVGAPHGPFGRRSAEVGVAGPEPDDGKVTAWPGAT